MKKDMLILFFCLFVVMLGFGSTLPVLPFYIERLALTEGHSVAEASLHVGVLTGIFAFMQFFFAPLWGRWSDRSGRKPLFSLGLAGYAISMGIFAIGTDLVTLYTARVVGGILSAAVLPTASAYVADVTSTDDRGRGMAWLGSATGLGIVFGPVMGAFLSQSDFYLTYRFGHFSIDGFSMPFFFAALLSLTALGIAMRWLPEHHISSEMGSESQRVWFNRKIESKLSQLLIFKRLKPFLAVSFLNQFSLAIFEGTFALHAKQESRFGPVEMGWIFMVCGFVMAAVQATVAARLMKAFGEKALLPVGFTLMGSALVMLMITRNLALTLACVGLFASGVGLIIPGLATLVSKQEGIPTGAAMGQLNAVKSLGLSMGPAMGGVLITWNLHSPYLLTALLLIGSAVYLFLSTFRKLF